MKYFINRLPSSKIYLSGIIFLLSVIIAFISFTYLQNISDRIHEQKYAELSAIAELKVNQLTQWISERNSEAKFFSENPTYIDNAAVLIRESQNRTAKESLQKGLSHIKDQHEYENIFVVSAEKQILFSLNENENELSSATLEFVDSTLANNVIVFSDFYFCDTSNRYHLDIIAPIKNREEKLIAVMLFRFDPGQYLYPLIKSWPLPSKTSETLLVRQVKDSVEFITELRHIKNKPHSLKISLSKNKIPSVQAVLGYRGIWEGVDYRGEEVVADIRPIANTNWFMIAKIDEDEILSELNSSYAYVILFSFFIILFISALAAFIYAYRQRDIYKKLWKSQEQLRKSEERFRVSHEMSPDGFTILHPVQNEKDEIVDFTWIYENQTVARINGTDPQKVIGKRLLEIFPNHRGTAVFETYLDVANTGKPRILKEVYIGEIVSKPTWLRIVVVSMGEDIAILSQDITDRKQLELERQKFFLLAESSSEFIGMCDLNMQPLYVNPAGRRMVGLPDMEAACSVKVQDYYFPDDQKFIAEEFFPDVLKKGHGNVEIRLRHFQTGEAIWMYYYLYKVCDASGKAIGWATVSRDISERRQAENKIIESEKRYRTLFENMTAGFVLFEVVPNEHGIPVDLIVVAANEGFEKTTGLNLKDAIGKHLTKVLPGIEKDEADWIGKYSQVALSGKSIHFKQGSELLGYYYSISAFQAAPKQCAVTFLDITDSIEKEQKLIKSEKRFRAIVEGAPDPIFIQTDMNFAYLNPAACELFGIKDSRELIGKPVMERFHPDYHEKIKNRISRLNDMQKPVEELLEQKFLRVDGSEVWVETAGEPINYEGKNGALVFVRDVSERKRIESELRKIEWMLGEKYDEILSSEETNLVPDYGDLSELNTNRSLLSRYKSNKNNWLVG